MLSGQMLPYGNETQEVALAPGATSYVPKNQPTKSSCHVHHMRSLQASGEYQGDLKNTIWPPEAHGKHIHSVSSIPSCPQALN